MPLTGTDRSTFFYYKETGSDRFCGSNLTLSVVTGLSD
jgi:hypothetical protein